MENKVTADYLDEEGCLHCGICGKRKQMKVSLMGFEHVVSCLCECEVKARQELDEKMQREEALPLGFIILLLCIVCGAVAVAIGIYVLKQRRLQRLKDPRKDYYR